MNPNPHERVCKCIPVRNNIFQVHPFCFHHGGLSSGVFSDEPTYYQKDKPIVYSDPDIADSQYYQQDKIHGPINPDTGKPWDEREPCHIGDDGILLKGINVGPGQVNVMGIPGEISKDYKVVEYGDSIWQVLTDTTPMYYIRRYTALISIVLGIIAAALAMIVFLAGCEYDEVLERAKPKQKYPECQALYEKIFQTQSKRDEFIAEKEYDRCVIETAPKYCRY